MNSEVLVTSSLLWFCVFLLLSISHFVVDAYCLSHFNLSYCTLCVYPVFAKKIYPLWHHFASPPQPFETFCHFYRCKMMHINLSAFYLNTLLSHSFFFFFFLCIYSFLQPSIQGILLNSQTPGSLSDTRCRQLHSLASQWIKIMPWALHSKM